MSSIKRSDKVIGSFGLLYILVYFLLTGIQIMMLIGLQEDFNKIAQDSCNFCTAEEEADIDGFIDYVQNQVVIWQVLWGFAMVFGFFALYVSIRLSEGINFLRASIMPDNDRGLFIWTFSILTLFLFALGAYEASSLNALVDEAVIITGNEGDGEDFPWSDTGGAMTGFCNTAFLFLILIIAFFTRGPPSSKPEETKENNSGLELEDLLDSETDE
jgi:hypothetical protein